MAIKTCTKCSETKLLSAFIKNASKPGGVDSECRRCRHLRENTPESLRERRDRDLRRRYGITLSDYTHMFIAQGGRCAICGNTESRLDRFGEPKPLSVDHDHGSGVVRGLLCACCNKGLGALGDTPKHLLSAFKYLFDRSV